MAPVAGADPAQPPDNGRLSGTSADEPLARTSAVTGKANIQSNATTGHSVHNAYSVRAAVGEFVAVGERKTASSGPFIHCLVSLSMQALGRRKKAAGRS
jgi:hypothetical protein